MKFFNLIYFQSDKDSAPPPVTTEETAAADDSVVIVEDEGVEPNVSNKTVETTESGVAVVAKEVEEPVKAKEASVEAKKAPEPVAKEASTFIASAAAGKILTNNCSSSLGSSINDVTQFLIIFDTPSPHRHDF